MRKEQTIAEEIAAKEAIKRSDKHFADQFLTISEQVRISKTLAAQLGVHMPEDDQCPD